MFEPEVEARFKRIEDAQVVAAELLHHFEQETRDRFRHVEAIQNAMARWTDQMADRQEDMARWMERMTERQEDTARWMERMTDRQEDAEAKLRIRQDETDAKLNALIEIVADLARTVDRLSDTVDRFLKSRSNGSGN